MSTAMGKANDAAIFESLLLRGDTSGLTKEQKVEYLTRLLKRVNLDWVGQPVIAIKLQGKEVFYFTKAATDQLARNHSINRTIVARERIDDVYVVTCRAQTADNRTEESIGAVSIGQLKGESLANALMKCETKAKRRATLSILGLGMLDESEIEGIPMTQIERVEQPRLEERAQPQSPTQTRIEQARRMTEYVEKLQNLGVTKEEMREHMIETTTKQSSLDLSEAELQRFNDSLQQWIVEREEKIQEAVND